MPIPSHLLAEADLLDRGDDVFGLRDGVNLKVGGVGHRDVGARDTLNLEGKGKGF